VHRVDAKVETYLLLTQTEQPTLFEKSVLHVWLENNNNNERMILLKMYLLLERVSCVRASSVTKILQDYR
jgi:hypothetical protein